MCQLRIKDTFGHGPRLKAGSNSVFLKVMS